MKISSVVEVCNQALCRIGQRSISSLNDDSLQASTCKLIYEQVKSKLLASYSWTFATYTEELRKVSDNSGLLNTDPAFDKTLLWFMRKFEKPAGFLRLIFITGADNIPLQNNEISPVYSNEGRYIKTDLTVCKMNYVKDIDTVGDFSPQFIDCLKLALAVELTKTFIDSSSHAEATKMEFEREFLKAKIDDAQQTMPYTGKPEYLNSTYGGF